MKSSNTPIHNAPSNDTSKKTTDWRADTQLHHREQRAVRRERTDSLPGSFTITGERTTKQRKSEHIQTQKRSSIGREQRKTLHNHEVRKILDSTETALKTGLKLRNTRAKQLRNPVTISPVDARFIHG